jgi:hypothetical protein
LQEGLRKETEQLIIVINADVLVLCFSSSMLLAFFVGVMNNFVQADCLAIIKGGVSHTAGEIGLFGV